MESQSREGKKQRSDQAQEGDPTSKRPRIDFATRQYQLHELQQQSKGKELENTDQLKERSVDEQSKSTEKPSGLYPSWSHSMNDVINDVTWDNMEFREVLARQQAEEARKQQQEAGPSHQGDPSSPSNHLELSIDDFELCSFELRKPHDQIQVPSSQSLPEIRQPFAAHHPAQAQRVEQRQDTLAQRHVVHDQADLSNAELSSDVIWEIPAGLTFEDVYIDYESHQGDTVQPSDIGTLPVRANQQCGLESQVAM